MHSREEIQQAIGEWNRKREQLLQACDRSLMYLSRERAALNRQDIISFYLQLIAAVFLGGPWPWADARMWRQQYKRAWLLIRELEKEQKALEKEYHLVVVIKQESETN